MLDTEHQQTYARVAALVHAISSAKRFGLTDYTIYTIISHTIQGIDLFGSDKMENKFPLPHDPGNG